MKEIIEKYLSGKTDAEEHRQLLSWIRQNSHLKYFQEIKIEWESAELSKGFSTASKERWNLLQGKLLVETYAQLKRSKYYLRIFQYAAVFTAFVLMAAVGIKWIGSDLAGDVYYNTMKADAGQIANVILPDETQVWLNSGSFIRYNNNFGLTNRKIELVGEAYFQVSKNPQLPLIVTGSPVQVKVLGTKFNISAYPDDKLFNVVLEEGKVELISDIYKNFRKELVPGELAAFDKERKVLAVKNVNVELHTAWKDGIINIYNLPLCEVVVKLSKRYNQRFKVDEDVKQIRYTYTIKNESLSDVLRLMETITPVIAVQEEEVINLKYHKQMKN
jgi:ferric-dicitrate binding protein FerR (iron transport regulator)